MKYIFLAIVTVCALTSSYSQHQGVCGKVLWVEGNQMPGPGMERAKPPGIIREVYIYEAVTTDQCKEENGFYSDISKPLIARIKSKKDGSFRVKLKPGIYSVFVKEKEGLWAPIFDGQGRINPITVSEKNWTTLIFEVNYEAAY
jgi:hypothetical protein